MPKSILRKITDIIDDEELTKGKDCSALYKQITQEVYNDFEDLYYDAIPMKLKLEIFTLYYEKTREMIEQAHASIANDFQNDLYTTTFFKPLEFYYSNMYEYKSCLQNISRYLLFEFGKFIQSYAYSKEIKFTREEVNPRLFDQYRKEIQNAIEEGKKKITIAEIELETKYYINSINKSSTFFDHNTKQENPYIAFFDRLIYNNIIHPKFQDQKEHYLAAAKFCKKQYCQNDVDKNNAGIKVLGFIIINNLETDRIKDFIESNLVNDLNALQKLKSVLHDKQLIRDTRRFSAERLRVIPKPILSSILQLTEEQISYLESQRAEDNTELIPINFKGNLKEFSKQFAPLLMAESIEIGGNKDSEEIVKEIFKRFQVLHEGQRVSYLPRKWFNSSSKVGYLKDIQYFDEKEKISSTGKLEWAAHKDSFGELFNDILLKQTLFIGTGKFERKKVMEALYDHFQIKNIKDPNKYISKATFLGAINKLKYS